MSRSLVAFHLDKLADAGLLDVSFAREPGRPAGRGGGRPSKRYQLSDLDLGIALPPRRYDVVGRILARTIGTSGQPDLAEQAWQLAAEEGRRLGQGGRDDAPATLPVSAVVEQALGDFGYQPAADGARIRIRNCPFLAVADAMPEAVCSVNHGFLTGLLEGLGAAGQLRVQQVPNESHGCCVEIAGPGTVSQGAGAATA
jgi:predicted ArsR family transcriptional regulator